MTRRPTGDWPVIPVFPLPNVVLFPDTVLPLHVFEMRYREMVRDASRADGRIAIALLRPGFESAYEGRPPIHSIGTLGRIEQLQPLDDGRFTLHVVGTQRVCFYEVDSDRAYRLAQAEPRPEHAVDERDPQVMREKLQLLASHAMLLREVSGGDEPGVLLNDHLPLAAAINGACANLPVAAAIRQELLEIDALRERMLRGCRLLDDALRQVFEMREAAGDDEGSGLVH